jgi:hypothetical protein
MVFKFMLQFTTTRTKISPGASLKRSLETVYEKEANKQVLWWSKDGSKFKLVDDLKTLGEMGISDYGFKFHKFKFPNSNYSMMSEDVGRDG